MASKQIGGGIVLFDTNTGGTGGGQNTANGITGDGSVGNPVVLGGNPLNQNTSILGTNFNFDMQMDDGAGTISAIVILPNAVAISSQEPISPQISEIAADPTAFSLLYQNDGPGAQRQVIGSKNDPRLTTGKGIGIKDTIDNIGLIGDVLFPESDPNQYAQYGNINDTLFGTRVNTPLEVISGSFSFGNVPAGNNQLLRIDPCLSVISLGTGCTFAFTLTYTDINAVTRTVNLATVATLAPAVVPSQVIYAKAGTGVSLNVTLGGTADGTYHVYGLASYLGVQNP